MRIAVTGRPGVGKSTVVRAALELMHRPYGGMFCGDIREDNQRVGFQLLDLATGQTGILSHVEARGPRVGKYKVNLADLEGIGVPAIEEGIRRGLVVVDEVAPMELKSERFIGAVEGALDSGVDMLVVVHAKSNHELAERIRREFKVVEVTEANRGWLPEWIATEFH